MASSDNDSLGWHTDPENPMLGPDGQLHDASMRPQQFLYSPSEEGAAFFHLQATAEDDLPSTLRKDVNTVRPKRNIKLIVCPNPLETLAQVKPTAKHKPASSSNQNTSDPNKDRHVENAFAKFRL